MLINIFFKLVYITVRLVHASYSLPEWQAFKLTFFDPTCCEPDPLYEPGNCKTMIRKQFSIFYTIISYKYGMNVQNSSGARMARQVVSLQSFKCFDVISFFPLSIDNRK